MEFWVLGSRGLRVQGSKVAEVQGSALVSCASFGAEAVKSINHAK